MSPELTRNNPVQISAEDLKKDIDSGRAEHAKDPTNYGLFVKMLLSEYMYSLHIQQENTLANAKRLGFLNVQELYPDLKPHSFQQCAKEWYALEKPEEIFARET